jgi:hypothetical protein
MLQLVGRTLLAFATAATIGVGASPALAAPVSAAAPVTIASTRPVAEPRLVDVDFDRRRNVDRIIFQFRGGVPDDVSARLVRVVRNRDGDRVRLDGRRFLVLRFADAQARGFDSDQIDTDDLRNVRAIRLVDDGRDDDVVRVALGLRNRPDDINVFERGNRLIVDVER